MFRTFKDVLQSNKFSCTVRRTLTCFSYNLEDSYRILSVQDVQKKEARFRSVVVYKDTLMDVVTTVSGLMLLLVVIFQQ